MSGCRGPRRVGPAAASDHLQHCPPQLTAISTPSRATRDQDSQPQLARAENHTHCHRTRTMQELMLFPPIPPHNNIKQLTATTTERSTAPEMQSISPSPLATRHQHTHLQLASDPTASHRTCVHPDGRDIRRMHSPTVTTAGGGTPSLPALSYTPAAAAVTTAAGDISSHVHLDGRRRPHTSMYSHADRSHHNYTTECHQDDKMVTLPLHVTERNPSTAARLHISPGAHITLQVAASSPPVISRNQVTHQKYFGPQEIRVVHPPAN